MGRIISPQNLVTMNTGKPIISFNDELYILKRIIKESENPILDDFKNILQADHVLRKEGKYYFCQKIDDAIVEEYILNEK